MTYDAIISNIWGYYADDDNSILRVNMAHIRRKLEQNPAEPQYIFTEIGIDTGWWRMKQGINGCCRLFVTVKTGRMLRPDWRFSYAGEDAAGTASGRGGGMCI